MKDYTRYNKKIYLPCSNENPSKYSKERNVINGLYGQRNEEG
jgi:hypothetical protein